MAYQGRGSFETRVLADRTRAFHMRFQVDGRRRTVVLHERSSCGCGCGGSWAEIQARRELDDLLARVRVGLWRPRTARTPVVKFVMSQVGHANSTMTMDVYAQLEQCAKRSHGINFDRLLADERD